MKGARILAVVLAAGLFAGVPFAYGDTAKDEQVQAKLAEQFARDKSLRDVHAAVENNVATLQGTVPLFGDKLKAEQKARKAGAGTVRDLVEVGGPAVSDAQLAQKLASKLAYQRVGYGNVFNALDVAVHQGVVTLAGVARTPADEAAYLSLVQTMPGVTDVVNRIQVAPVSTFDDGLRLRLVRAIYGDPMLSKYAMDPAAPIRIVVENGHIALYGTVDNNVDRQIAGMRASQVFGGFSVANHLVTPNGRAR